MHAIFCSIANLGMADIHRTGVRSLLHVQLIFTAILEIAAIPRITLLHAYHLYHCYPQDSRAIIICIWDPDVMTYSHNTNIVFGSLTRWRHCSAEEAD